MKTSVGELWEPGNYQGSIHYDPRDELHARARRAQDGHDAYVAIPVALALACAGLRECAAHTVSTGDEDGPLSSPVEIICRRPQDHSGMHFNGYVNWGER